ncbi:hypothetical protein LCGC14_0312800 [marine sediment metagenome]|uniref:IstB-like ATP-binding domain-containing protein n=1 Tax=marine sediment metagenome TaxID=412755 RepID=A0A0F9WT62_9ZZZZ
MPCECQDVRLRAERHASDLYWDIVRLPLRGDFLRWTFEAWEHVPKLEGAFTVAMAMADGKPWPSVLLFAGPSGTGKTHLGVAAVRRAQQRGVPARYVYVASYLTELRGFMFGEGDADSQKMTAEKWEAIHIDLPLLVLDDYGVSKDTDWTDERLDRLIAERDANGDPTILTTNLDIDQLPTRIRDRVTGTKALNFRFAVPSYRQRKGA